ncbi:hypothetical protein [Streptomyces sp. NPDC020362]|uniref:hypothetical protein n=1 Tax=unclassified Streptomyces TaxID=2593676 RepID=UPI000A76D459
MPDFVASVLSEQLGRSIDIGQIWPERFPDTGPGGVGGPAPGAPWSEQHVDRALRALLDQEEHGTGPCPRSGEPVPGPELVALAVDWLTADTTLASARSDGPELPAEMVEVLAGRITRLRRLSASQDSALIRKWVVHELDWTRHLTRNAAYDAPTGRRLYGATAELAQLAGWLAEEKGLYTQGQQYLLVGLHASGLAGDRNLGAYILSCLSYHLTKCGNGRDALRLIKLADIGMEDAVPGVLRSLQASREACARAGSGDEWEPVDRTDPDGALPLLGLEERIAAALLGREDESRLPRQAEHPDTPVSEAEVRTVASPACLSCCGEFAEAQRVCGDG